MRKTFLAILFAALLFAGTAAAQQPAQPDLSKYVNTFSRPLREVLADMNIWNAKGINKPADFIESIDDAVAVMHWVKDAR